MSELGSYLVGAALGVAIAMPIFNALYTRGLYQATLIIQQLQHQLADERVKNKDINAT